MKIGEFAEACNVTKKMLRHYDEIDLLKPSATDSETGYRVYTHDQVNRLNWIIVLKNLGFSLVEIKGLLTEILNAESFVKHLKNKRAEISSSLDEQIQKRISIDGLIKLIEREGIQMEKNICLTDFSKESVHEIKKNIPNPEVFLENVTDIYNSCSPDDYLSALRLDIWHFKQVNDDFGFDVGDAVIVEYYRALQESLSCIQKHTLARSHGDEFTVFIKADAEEAKRVAENIVENIKNRDFASIGCHREMACYIGINCVKASDIKNIRKMLNASHIAIHEARQQQPSKNCIWLVSLVES